MALLRIGLYALTALGLVINAIIHLQLAGPFDAVTGSLVSQGDLFRIQSGAGILVAVLLVAVRRAWVALVAAVLAAGGLGLLILSTLVLLDLTALGLPPLFEPVWYADKIIAAVAQAVALVAALTLALLERRQRRVS